MHVPVEADRTATSAMVMGALTAGLLCTTPAFAQVHLAHAVLGGGAVVATGPSHRMAATVGEPAAGRTDGLSAGFWFVAPADAASGTETESRNANPQRFWLYQNYPNPFNPTTSILVDIPAPVHVELKVFDILGRDVAVLADQRLEPGRHRFTFIPRGLPSGAYFYVVHAGAFRASRPMLIIR